MPRISMEQVREQVERRQRAKVDEVLERRFTASERSVVRTAFASNAACAPGEIPGAQPLAKSQWRFGLFCVSTSGSGTQVRLLYVWPLRFTPLGNGRL